MSSMFKKKTGVGFKPKAPVARPRPPGASQAQRPSQPPPAAIESPSSTSATNTPATQSPARDAAATSDPTPPVTQPQASEKRAPVDGGPSAEIAPTVEPSPAEPSATEPATNKTPKVSATETTEKRATPAAARAKNATPALHAPEVVTSTTVPTIAEAESTPVDDAPSTSTTTEGQTTPAAAPKKTAARKPRKRAAAAVAEDGAEGTSSTGTGQDGEASAEGAPTKKRRTARKAAGESTVKVKKRKPSDSVSTDVPELQATPRSRQRSATPEDAENQVVDLSSMTMADLTKDLRIGKKSKVHDMLLAREREKLAALKLRKAGLTPDGDASLPGTPTSTSQPVSFLDKEPPSSEPTGLQYTMIGGQIVVDQSSLSLDRHERARQQQIASGGITHEMEEDDFTNHITETSFRTGSKLRGPNYWNDADTELFYRGLAMLGTDFTLISRMFPGRNRRHVKMKFNREEKSNPARVNAAIVGTKSMSLDMDEYKHWTKAEYEPVEDIMAAHRAKEAEFEEQTKRAAEEKAEANRKKKEALFADEEGVDGAVGSKKKGKKKRKNAVETNLWGEIVEETPIDTA